MRNTPMTQEEYVACEGNKCPYAMRKKLKAVISTFMMDTPLQV